MSMLNANSSLRPVAVHFSEVNFTVELEDGRRITTPIALFPRLQAGNAKQRNHWEVIGREDALHWPDLDEDISIAGLLRPWDSTTPDGTGAEPVFAVFGEIFEKTRMLTRTLGRPFTLDGHLLAEMGRSVAEHVYGLKLITPPERAVDAYAAGGESVAIMLTGESSARYMLKTAFGDLRTPDLLLCLQLTSAGFQEIYNGPYPYALLQERSKREGGKVSLATKKLDDENPALLPKKHSLASVNRYLRPVSHAA